MATARSSIRRNRPPGPTPPTETVADLLNRLGRIPARRVRLKPSPGTATERDLVDVNGREGGLCELVEGTLVEKPMGYAEAELALRLGAVLLAFIDRHKLGIVAGPDGPLKVGEGTIRLPDVSFVSWGRLPGRRRPKGAVVPVAPDLAVEVLSKSNTKGEVARKLGEYFAAGTRLAWIVDPRTKSIRVHTSPAEATLLGIGDALDGGDNLPGFRLPLTDLFPPEAG